MGNGERKVYVVLGAGALGYARYCFASLFRQSLEALHVRLITDGAEDVKKVAECVAGIEGQERHRWEVIGKAQTDERAAEFYRGRAEVLAFRGGHPCWRKVTDPVMYAEAGEECVLLDPDLYFPNPFTFEATPGRGILLMWQKPNCLYPPESVYGAFTAPVQLADHVDIGVAHVREVIDWQWVDWLIGRLGGWRGANAGGLPRSMHIEAILWSALAMKMGGGYLDRAYWVCWRRSAWKRVLMKARVSGVKMMRREKLMHAKCFHAGGHAKYWIADAAKAGILESGEAQREPGTVMPFEELRLGKYETQQRMKRVLKGMGFYKVMGG